MGLKSALLLGSVTDFVFSLCGVEMILSLIGESKNVAHLMLNLAINALLKPSLPSGTSALKNLHIVLGEFYYLCFQAEGLDINPLVPTLLYI